MKKFLSGCIPALVCLSAHAELPPEPPIESNPVGMLIFGVLFVGFCVGFIWMIWRNKEGKDKKE
jgi:hypothetical protein